MIKLLKKEEKSYFSAKYKSRKKAKEIHLTSKAFLKKICEGSGSSGIGSPDTMTGAEHNYKQGIQGGDFETLSWSCRAIYKQLNNPQEISR